MARFSTSVFSPAGAVRVFDDLAAFHNIVRWDPGVLEAERLDEGPLGVGSAFRLLCAFGPQRIPLTYVIRDYQAPHRVVLEASTDVFTSLDVITVAPQGGGSVVTYDATLTLHGWRVVMDPLLHVAFGVVGRRAAAGLRGAMAALGADRVAGAELPVSAGNQSAPRGTPRHA